jgi:hypothetical protein
MALEGFNDEKYMHVYRSKVFSIPLYRTNQNMIGIGLSLLWLTYRSFSVEQNRFIFCTLLVLE